MTLIGKLAGHELPINHVAFLPDGRRAISVCITGSQTCCWSLEERKALWTFEAEPGIPRCGVVAVSPDGKRVAVGVADGFIHLLDAETGKEQVRWKAHDAKYNHDDDVTSLVWSPNSDILASVPWGSGGVKLWNMKASALPTPESVPEEIDTGEKPLLGETQGLSFSHTSDYLFTGGNAYHMLKIAFWSNGNYLFRRFLTPLEDDMVTASAASPDGQLLAFGRRSGKVTVFERGKDYYTKQVAEIAVPGSELGFLSGAVVHSVGFTPDGRFLFVAAGDNNAAELGVASSLTLWDVEDDFRSAFTHTSAEPIFAAAVMSPDGSQLLTGGGRYDWDQTQGRFLNRGDCDLHWWRLPESVWSQSVRPQATPEELILEGRLQGHDGVGMPNSSIAASADGRWLISAGGSDKTARLWDAATGEAVFIMPMERDRPDAVAISGDGQRAVVRGEKGRIDIWDLAARTKLRELEQIGAPGVAMAFSSDGRRLVMGASPSGESMVWDIESGNCLHRHVFQETISRCVSIPGTSLVLLSGNQLWQWDVEQGEIQRLAGSPQTQRGALDVSADGSRVAILAKETIAEKPLRVAYAIEVRDLRTGEFVQRVAGSQFDATEPAAAQMLPMSVCYMTDKRLIAVGYVGAAGAIRVWNVETGNEVAQKQGLDVGAQQIVALPEGRIASFGSALPGKPGRPDILVWRLPENDAANKANDDPIVVAVKAGGRYFLNGREVDNALALAERLKFLLEDNASREVVVDLPEQLGLRVAREMVHLVRQCGATRVRSPDWVKPAASAELENRSAPDEKHETPSDSIPRPLKSSAAP